MTEEQIAQAKVKAQTMTEGMYGELDIYINQLVESRLKSIVDALLSRKFDALNIENQLGKFKVGVNSATNEVMQKVDTQMTNMQNSYDKVAKQSEAVMNSASNKMDDITKDADKILNEQTDALSGIMSFSSESSRSNETTETTDNPDTAVQDIINMFN